MPRPMEVSSSGGGTNRSSASTDISYEDALIAQYLEELRKSRNAATDRSSPGSPYVQRLAHSHIVPTSYNFNMRARPYSASASMRPRSATKMKIDTKFYADHDHWDNSTSRSIGQDSVRRRPLSAPARRRSLGRTISRPGSAKSGSSRRSRGFYKQQPHTIVVQAYRNGTRDVSTRVAAPNLKVLLELCTERLGMNSAARRIFLQNGKEIFMAWELQRDAEIFVSSGEKFKDPFKGVKQDTKQSNHLNWTMNGLVWNADAKKKSTKPRVKKIKNLLGMPRRRVLVFKNSHGTEGVEIVADPERFEEFLEECTAKLDLGTYARTLYDWNGKEIHDLKQAPVLDECLQTWSTPVLGPLWVSKGECFSPKGVDEFLRGLITYTKAKLSEAKHYKEQLMLVQDEETRDKVEIVPILSMAEEEVEETLIIVAKDIDDFTNALKRLKQQLKNIKDMVDEEESLGNGYALRNKKEMKMNDPRLGRKGLRLRVFENGRYDDHTEVFFNTEQAGRGRMDNKTALEMLLDACSNRNQLVNPKVNVAIKPIAEKLYDKYGTQITSVWNLKQNQELWLSFGEKWRNPFTFVMTAQFDKVHFYDIVDGKGKVALREQLMAEDIAEIPENICCDTCGILSASTWEAITGIPDDLNPIEVQSGNMESAHVFSLLDISEISIYSSFLRCKNKQHFILYGDCVMDNKKTRGSKDVWPLDAQVWKIHLDGTIRSKAMPHLVLGVTDFRVKGHLKDPLRSSSEEPTYHGSHTEGFMVGLQVRTGMTNQQWVFQTNGLISSMSEPSLYLTYMGSRFNDEATMIENEEEDVPSGVRCFVAVCPKIEGKDSKAQRWAIKQEKMENLGQWKASQVPNPEWNKRALSWPVKKDGSINEDFDWPMEGCLMAYAPPIKANERTHPPAGKAPLRLMVMKNGSRDISLASAVVGPDLATMKKSDSNKKKKKTKKPHKHATTNRNSGDGDSVISDQLLHCDDDLTVLQLEFILFLERCTMQLELPFAARRLFDATGKEHFSLRDLKRDQLCYVSTGEPWTDPNLTKAEQQRRQLLANLTSDITQIEQFLALRDPNELVLAVEHSLEPGSHVIVNELATAPENIKENRPATDQKNTDAPIDSLEDPNLGAKLSYHEQSHKHADDLHNKKKFPWEQDLGPVSNGETDENEQNFSNKEMYHKFKPKRKQATNVALQLQHFTYEDGYFIASNAPHLCLGINELDGRSADVILVKKRPDDIFQRWILHENGIIQAKCNPTMVLTVSLPTVQSREDYGEKADMTYIGCQVTIQSRKATQFGRANQRWMFDETLGIIHAFSTDKMDKEVTAANKANVCTYAVMGGLELDQPGYEVEMPVAKTINSKKITVCSSCARAMRGRYKLEKIPRNIDFACAMGIAKDIGIRQIGSFKCLNGKVDLSTHEAEHTLKEWHAQLANLRTQLSVRTIAQHLSSARTPYTVKVLAYKNGAGRLKQGEIIMGSSLPGMLAQCNKVMGLPQAARRLYTLDGTLILDVDDLVHWAQNHYKELAEKDQQKGKKTRKNVKSINGGTDLISKVDLDESEEEEEGIPANGETADIASQNKSSEDEEDTESDNLFAVGSEILPGRQHVDDLSSFMAIPNPDDKIAVNGHIIWWSVYVTVPGTLLLQILRRKYQDTKPDLYTVVDQLEFSTEEAGEFNVDVLDIPDSPWGDKGMPVQEGDVIGFYCPGKVMLAYDEEGAQGEPPRVNVSKGRPKKDKSYDLKPWAGAIGARSYSLTAVIQAEEDLSSVKKNKKKPNAAAPMVTESLHNSKPDNNQGKSSNETSPPKKSTKKKSKSNITLPPIDIVLKYPVQVWVSCGEDFIKPEKVEKHHERQVAAREERAAVSFELDKEKHILRQMQGRRYDQMTPGKFLGTMNPERPVVIEGQWIDPTLDEQVQHDTIHQLQTHLSEVKMNQKLGTTKSSKSESVKRLYTQPAMKRVLVFPNGESITRAVYVWGDTVPQILDNSTTRLNMNRAGKYLFDMKGHILSEMDEIERDQLLCISHSKTFKRPKESHQTVEIKANWGRARRKFGPSATDIIVKRESNPNVDILESVPTMVDYLNSTMCNNNVRAECTEDYAHPSLIDEESYTMLRILTRQNPPESLSSLEVEEILSNSVNS